MNQLPPPDRDPQPARASLLELAILGFLAVAAFRLLIRLA